MKFDALRSSVARLFETAATLVAPKSSAMPDGLTQAVAMSRAEAEAKFPPHLVAGKVTSDGFQPLKEPSIRIPQDGLGKVFETGRVVAEAKADKAAAEAKVAGLEKAAEIEKAIRDAMPGVDVGVKVIGDGEDISAKIIQDIVEQAKSHGTQPPPDDAARWSMWTKLMADEVDHAPPGWAFCRIGNRQCSQSGKPEDDTVEFTYGFARGSFGVWRKTFDTCEVVGGPYVEIKESSRTLTVVTHLQSGTGMGLFFNNALAAEACELIERSVTDLNAFDPNKAESWSPLFNRIVLIWKTAGIRRATTHAHVTGTDGEESPPIAIFERTDESMNHGRPEKLS